MNHSPKYQLSKWSKSNPLEYVLWGRSYKSFTYLDLLRQDPLAFYFQHHHQPVLALYFPLLNQWLIDSVPSFQFTLGIFQCHQASCRSFACWDEALSSYSSVNWIDFRQFFVTLHFRIVLDFVRTVGWLLLCLCCFTHLFGDWSLPSVSTPDSLLQSQYQFQQSVMLIAFLHASHRLGRCFWRGFTIFHQAVF